MMLGDCCEILRFFSEKYKENFSGFLFYPVCLLPIKIKENIKKKNNSKFKYWMLSKVEI